MTKFIVKQVPVDVQMSDFDGDDFEHGNVYENCVIVGNRDFSQYGCLNDEIDKWNNNIDDIYDAVQEKDFAFLKQMFKNGANSLKLYQKALDSKQIVDVLQAITGRIYNEWCLRGSCQSDWQYFYTPAADEYWDLNTVADLEQRYFNTGDEWQIEINPELIGEGSSDATEVVDFYTTGSCGLSNDAEIKKIAAEALCDYGIDPNLANVDNILVQKFVGFEQIPVYCSEDVALSETESKQEFVEKLGKLFAEYNVSQIKSLKFIDKNTRELVEVTDGDRVYNVAVDGDSNFAIAYDVIRTMWNH